jgi:hypothetical protein
VFADDLHTVYCATVQTMVVEEEPTFMPVGVSDLASELLALRMEVMAAAWTHRLREKLAVAQSEFTKSYLAQTGRESLWDQMGAYNKIVARAATHGLDPQSPMGRARIVSANLYRADSFDAWAKTGRDMEAAARVINRLLTDTSRWRTGLVQHLLAIELLQRLHFAGTDETRTKLAAVAEGFYRGAAEAMEGVKLVL